MHLLALLLLSTTYGFNMSESGLPYVRDTVPVEAIAGDIESRTYITMTPNETWCTFDEYFYDYCGGVPSQPYLYCIYSPTWPPDNLTDWLNQTVFGPMTAVWSTIPIFCACNVSGHAVWVAEDPRMYLSYNSICSQETATIALFLILIIIFTFLSLFALLEIIMWSVKITARESKLELVSTFFPKAFILLSSLTLIANISIKLNPNYANVGNTLTFAHTWTFVFAFIFSTLGYLWWLVVFTTVVRKIKHMDHRQKACQPDSILLTTAVTTLLLVVIISTAVGIATGRQAIDTPNFPEKQQLQSKYYSIFRAGAIVGLLGLLFDASWGTLLCIKAVIDLRATKGTSKDSAIIEKCLWNASATVFFWVVVACWLAETVFVNWAVNVYTDYQRNCLGFLWINFVLMFAAAGNSFSILMALRTMFDEGDGYCKTIVRGGHTIVSRASNRSKSSNRGDRN